MTHRIRRHFLTILMAITLAMLAPSVRSACGADRPLVGAIRWDAWHGDRGVGGRAVQASLGPRRYHWRLPFFARVITDDKVVIDGITTQTMTREIAYARTAGLDYWAFFNYDESDTMSLGLKLYLANSHKAGIRFCMIGDPPRLGVGREAKRKQDRIVRLAGEPTYLKVAGGRPLLFIGFITEEWIKKFGGPAGTRRYFDDLRARFTKAGLANPYLVIMDFNPAQARRVQQMAGADAISAYAAMGDGRKAPYARLAEYVTDFWTRCKATGAPVIPLAMSGWDRRPRIEHPVIWESWWQKPGDGMDRYYEAPTPLELAAHVRQAMDWTVKNKQSCPVPAVLIYAWNECDEGGWLVPTLKEGGGIDTGRVEALGGMIRNWK